MTQQVLSKTAGDAVLQAAIQMEDIGRDCYEAMAAATADSAVKDLCRRLAAAELNHREAFQRMRSKLASRGQTVLLQDSRIAQARQSAKETVLPDPETIRRMASQGNVRALLDLAVRMEEDSISFYRSFAASVPDRDVLDAIIREEQEHLRLLMAAPR